MGSCRTPPLLSAVAAAAAALVLCTGCADRAQLLIELRGGSLDLVAADNASVNIALLDVDAGAQVLFDTDISGAALAGRASLTEGFERFAAGGHYRLRVIANVPSGCAKSNGRAVGVSPEFSYDDTLTRVPVYVDCADSSQTAGSVKQPRLFHTATWVPQGGPLGSVLLVGGARWDDVLTIGEQTKATVYDSIERYDPDTDTSQLLSAHMATPRWYHQAVRLADDSVVVLGGLNVTGVGGATAKAEVLSSVERVVGDRVTGLANTALPHAVHTALLVAPDRILVVGGIAKSLILPTYQAELYDPAAGRPVGEPLKTVGAHLPGVAAVVGDRALIYADLPSPLVPPQAQRFCSTSGCSCSPAPCFDKLPGLPDTRDRTSLAAGLVRCATGDAGALYLVGGRRDETNWKPAGPDTFFRDIFCVDVQSPAEPRLVGELSDPRAAHTVSVVRGAQGARLFVAGGVGPNGRTYASAELLDVPCACPTDENAIGPGKTVSLNQPRFNHTATVLPDGSVLLVGGLIGTDSAERFVPDVQ